MRNDFVLRRLTRGWFTTRREYEAPDGTVRRTTGLEFNIVMEIGHRAPMLIGRLATALRMACLVTVLRVFIWFVESPDGRRPRWSFLARPYYWTVRRLDGLRKPSKYPPLSPAAAELVGRAKRRLKDHAATREENERAVQFRAAHGLAPLPPRRCCDVHYPRNDR